MAFQKTIHEMVKKQDKEYEEYSLEAKAAYEKEKSQEMEKQTKIKDYRLALKKQ